MTRMTIAAALAVGCGQENGLRAQLDPPGAEPSEHCEAPQRHTQQLTFPARSGCAFSIGGNLEPRNEFVQARAEEAHAVQLPRGATVCGWSLSSAEDDLTFDDHLALLVDDIVLVTGGSGLAFEEYPEAEGLPRFDWAQIRGRPFSGRYDPYTCLGDSVCGVPETERTGPLELVFDDATMSEIAGALQDPADFDLTLVTFGDDDGGDCAHSALTADLEVRYDPGS